MQLFLPCGPPPKIIEGNGALFRAGRYSARNATKVSAVTRADGVPKLQCAGSDYKVTERKINSLRSLLTVEDPHDELRCRVRHRMDWDLTSKLSTYRRRGDDAKGAMGGNSAKFGHGPVNVTENRPPFWTPNMLSC